MREKLEGECELVGVGLAFDVEVNNQALRADYIVELVSCASPNLNIWKESSTSLFAQPWAESATWGWAVSRPRSDIEVAHTSARYPLSAQHRLIKEDGQIQ